MIIRGRSRDSATVVQLTELTRLRTAVGLRHWGYNKIIIILYRTVVTKLWFFFFFNYNNNKNIYYHRGLRYLCPYSVKVYGGLRSVPCGNDYKKKIMWWVRSCYELRLSTIIIILSYDVHYIVYLYLQFNWSPVRSSDPTYIFARPKVNYCWIVHSRSVDAISPQYATAIIVYDNLLCLSAVPI